MDHTIGATNSGTELIIRNGGTVLNNNGFVGATSTASNNTVTVTGSGSVWENLGTLQIGAVSNAGNSVTVEGQGVVIADQLSISNNNSFVLDSGGTLRMTGAFDYSTQSNLTWNGGGTLSIGGTLSGLDEMKFVVEGVTIPA